MASYTVYIDDNFSMDQDERYESGVFDTYEEAEAKCKQILDDFLESAITDRSLWGEYKDGLTANNLVDKWLGFGENPFIMPAKDDGFISSDYVKQRSKDLVKSDTNS